MPSDGLCKIILISLPIAVLSARFRADLSSFAGPHKCSIHWEVPGRGVAKVSFPVNNCMVQCKPTFTDNYFDKKFSEMISVANDTEKNYCKCFAAGGKPIGRFAPHGKLACHAEGAPRRCWEDYKRQRTNTYTREFGGKTATVVPHTEQYHERTFDYTVCEQNECKDKDCAESVFPSVMEGRSDDEKSIIADIIKKFRDKEKLDRDEQEIVDHLTQEDIDAVFSSPPPNCAALLTKAGDLVSTMAHKADVAETQLEQALFSLNEKEFQFGFENHTATDEGDAATDVLLGASQDHIAAGLAEEKLRLMVQACTDLYSTMESFKTSSEPTAAFQRNVNEESLQRDIERLKRQTVAIEQQDLSKLLALVDAILEHQKRVIELDAIVGAGATPGIQGATTLVMQYVDQLQERQRSITSADALSQLPPLQPEDAKLEVDKAVLSSLDKASEKISEIIFTKGQAYKQALAQVSKIRQNHKQSNATTMKDIVQDMQQAGKAKALAEALKGAIEETLQATYSFFTAIATYRSTQNQRKLVAQGEIQTLISKAEDLRKQIDISVLLEVEDFFQGYAMMWGYATAAEEPLTGRSQEFTTLLDDVHGTAVAVHEWLNGELQSLCEYHQGCMKVRALVFGEVEKHVNHCDERFTEFYCENQHGGYAPNGRTCRWIQVTEGQKDQGLREYCKSVRPPTKGLKYHQDHPDGPGIFY